MSLQQGRYQAPKQAQVAKGWSLERLTPPSRLFGANGLRTGPDGRIYVAQVTGSQISALDLKSGALETISAKGGDIIAPDDVAFGPGGELYATEVMDGRVSVLSPNGRARVLRDDVPNANGITVHQGRLFINECRVGGRVMELDLSGGAPRVLLENVPMPNAMEVGPDGMLYFPVMATSEIWRVHPDGGASEVVATGLGMPDAVKFDADGFIVSTQVATGDVVRVDPRSGDKTVLASLPPGLDNLTFADGRLFVSHFTGRITEILPDGGTRTLLEGGLNWPLDLTVDGAGKLYVADGTFFYQLVPGGELRTLGMMMSPNYPSFIRGAVATGDGVFTVTNSNGQISRYTPASNENDVLAEGFDQLYGLDVADDGTVIAAELGAGRVVSARSGEVQVLAKGLSEPRGVAITGDGACLVSETGAGRVLTVTSAGTETLVDGLEAPHGLLVRDGVLYIVDAGAKALVAFDLETRKRKAVASALPLGAPAGVTPKPLRGMPPFSGPQGPFAGIAAGPDGTLYVSADADGSVLALKPAGRA